ncbi:MAG TPA: WD40 repeat domain-containing protein [Planctomycetaceae bacterium]|nr:WD40 repeat domain-containing protein [Planctomycetaceae bacterium]
MLRFSTRGPSSRPCSRSVPRRRRGSALVELTLLGAVVGGVVAAVVMSGSSNWGMPFDPHEKAVPLYAAAVTPDGSRVFLSNAFGSGEVWSLHDRTLWDRHPCAGIMLHAAAYSRDGQSLATTCALGTVTVWHEVPGQARATSTVVHPQGGTAVAFSPDGSLLASAGIDGDVCVSLARDLSLVRKWKAHENHIRSLAFSPDGTRVLTASRDGTVGLWDAATGRQLRRSVAHAGQTVEAVAWSPDGRLIASGAWDGSVVICEAETGEPLHSMNGRAGNVTSLAFSADSQRLASGSWGNSAHVWNVADGSLMQTLDDHGSLVRTVAFVPQNDQLVTSSWDGAVRVWDWRTKTEVQRFTCKQ